MCQLSTTHFWWCRGCSWQVFVTLYRGQFSHIGLSTGYSFNHTEEWAVGLTLTFSSSPLLIRNLSAAATARTLPLCAWSANDVNCKNGFLWLFPISSKVALTLSLSCGNNFYNVAKLLWGRHPEVIIFPKELPKSQKRGTAYYKLVICDRKKLSRVSKRATQGLK